MIHINPKITYYGWNEVVKNQYFEGGFEYNPNDVEEVPVKHIDETIEEEKTDHIPSYAYKKRSYDDIIESSIKDYGLM